MPILNLGSLNIDDVYRVAAVAKPGETVAGRSFTRFGGGKGANQSVALARAGAAVAHAGRVGVDGAWLVAELAAAGVDTAGIEVGEGATGHAVIQVDDAGQNAIVVHGGENREIGRAQIRRAIAAAPPGARLLLQNEISGLADAVEAARERRMPVCFNPAPLTEDARAVLPAVDLLVVNESEGAGLAGEGSEMGIIRGLARLAPRAEVVLTLGARGVLYHAGGELIRVPAVPVRAVDTTAAGDTFLGYFLALADAGTPEDEALAIACKAAAICVTRPGAMRSIPTRDEVFTWAGGPG